MSTRDIALLMKHVRNGCTFNQVCRSTGWNAQFLAKLCKEYGVTLPQD